MSWAQAADWIQAIGSVAAIIIAIWTVRQQANRERDNRVIDDAAFASYIKKYLSNDVEAKIQDIADPERLFGAGADIREVSHRAVERYETEVVKRLKKLADLSLTEWPDIQLANAFNDAYLRMQTDLAKLKENQGIAAREADEELRRLEQARRDAARAIALENERLEDMADEYEGSIDDDQVVALPPRGQRHRTLERKLWVQSDAEDGWESYDSIRARDAAEEASWDIAWSRQARDLAMEELKTNLFEPLKQITASWQERDADLRTAIERYIDRAKRYGLPTTYDGRANRPKRLAPIFR